LALFRPSFVNKEGKGRGVIYNHSFPFFGKIEEKDKITVFALLADLSKSAAPGGLYKKV
jgi:hypothetical protein